MKYIFVVLLFFVGFLSYSQDESKFLSITWENPIRFEKDSSEVFVPNCKSCQLLDEIPYYSGALNVTDNGKKPKLVILKTETSPLKEDEVTFMQTHSSAVGEKPDFSIQIGKEDGKNTYYLVGHPFVKINGEIRKINRMIYSIHYTDYPVKAKSYATTSVLESATKKWYKIAVNQDGIYKIDKAFLAAMGVNTNQLNPNHINVYGNGGGQLSVNNSDYRPDDLIKNPIYVKGEADQSFDEGDYILFQGFGPSKWSYVNGDYRRATNPYTHSSYYFICISEDETPLRISNESSSISAETATIHSYDFSLIHEQDLENLVRGGQRFYGEIFDSELTKEFNFSVPDYLNTPSKLMVSYAFSNVGFSGNVQFYVNGNLIKSNALGTTSSDSFTRNVVTLDYTPSANVNVKIVVNRSNPGVVVYLDKIELMAQRKLKYNNHQTSFRTIENIGTEQVNKYVLANANANLQVWDITNRTFPKKIITTPEGNSISFKSSSETVHEFVAFSPDDALTPVFVGNVAHQDLHGMGFADILIVTASKFLSEANRLAQLHENDGSTVQVATVEQVFNEFSGGQKDPVAIRQFVKMFYDRSNGNVVNQPKNLVLFGNGNYDPRGIIFDSDYVPTYQAENSEVPISAFTTDDFFGVLDDEEGFDNASKMDIGVGRIPVSELSEAKIVVDKAISYLQNSYQSNPTFADWRLKYTLIADDEDSFLLNDTEPVYNKMKNTNPEMNATKIYADAYPQQITAGGIRFPQMEEDINRSVEEGRLVVAYVGHGGTKGAGQERFIDRNQISGWENPDRMNLFMSATCDFTRADDPQTNSAGETMLLNPKGGAVALMTTNRSIYYSVNTRVDSSFFSAAFKRDANHRPLTFGEIFRRTKNNSGIDDNRRSFMLIGDPALRLALPSLRVITDSINGKGTGSQSMDTLKALTKMTISGHIADYDATFLSDFNGILTASVFDKEKLNKTQGHIAGKSSIQDFYTQENILYRGNVSVENGRFTFSFYVPKDINYQFGKGKISYYAQNGFVDAFGFDTTIVVGGINPNGLQDDEPPVIEAYMNDETFVDGSITDENPIFIARLSDNIGINAVGNGIGHDITLVMDGNEAQPIVLNNYFITDLDSYQSGSIRYPMKNIPEGTHQLKIKAWDVNNNSAVHWLNFRVVKSTSLEIENVMNYPNPMTDHTTFSFEHNQQNSDLQVSIQISTPSGQIVKTIEQTIYSEGFKSSSVVWDGTSDGKNRLSNGLYLYSLSVTDSKGNKVRKTGKLMLL